MGYSRPAADLVRLALETAIMSEEALLEGLPKTPDYVDQRASSADLIRDWRNMLKRRYGIEKTPQDSLRDVAENAGLRPLAIREPTNFQVKD